MAMSSPHGAHRVRRRHSPMSEINVTPMVDVMLVLLIVFMVTAPLMTPGVPIDLPESQARPLPEDQTPLAVTLDHNGAIFLDESQIKLAELIPRLQAIAVNKADTRIYLRADRRLDYGSVMEVMGLLNAAGFRKVALVSDKKR